MKPLAILLFAAGVVSAASVPIEARQNALSARQDASNEEVDIDTAAEGEVDVEEDAEVAVEVEVDEEEQAVAEEEAEEVVEEEVEDENVDEEGTSSGGATSGNSSNGNSSTGNFSSGNSSFSNFSLDDFLGLGVNDVLGIPNLRQHEVDLAAALLGMLNLFGLRNVVTANDLIGFGFQVELQMFLALQQIGQLLSAGRIGVNDAFVLIQNNILRNGINSFGRNGFNGLNGFNFGGFGNGRAFSGVSNGRFRSGSGGRVIGK